LFLKTASAMPTIDHRRLTNDQRPAKPQFAPALPLSGKFFFNFG